MTSFKYAAKGPGGKSIEGEIQATDRNEVLSELRRQNLVVMSIDEVKQANNKQTQHYEPGHSLGVPYRCLVPQELNNVLVAGRCISTDRAVNGTTRIMACCLNTGEAAGIAAAMALKDNAHVRAVDADDLRARLKEEGAYLP